MALRDSEKEAYQKLRNFFLDRIVEAAGGLDQIPPKPEFIHYAMQVVDHVDQQDAWSKAGEAISTLANLAMVEQRKHDEALNPTPPKQRAN